MFNLTNTPEEKLSKENILKYVSEYEIYQYYIPSFNIGGKMCSPLREDNNPSFGIFIGKYGDLAFNDYKLGGGDCFKFVSMMENVSYYDALIIVNNIFKLNLYCSRTITKTVKHKKPSLINKEIKKKKKPKISIKIRNWNQNDIDYLYPLNVNKLKWIPIQFYWIDEQMFNTDVLAYAFKYGTNIYKIYQPNLETKNGKWWSNIDVTNTWFGHSGLDYSKDIMFVMSSNKDASVMHQLNYNAIAPHTEHQIFSKEQYEYYSSKFKRIIIFYDNDEVGISKAVKFSEAWNLDYIYLEEEETKDPFEYIKLYSMEDLDNWINKII